MHVYVAACASAAQQYTAACRHRKITPTVENLSCKKDTREFCQYLNLFSLRVVRRVRGLLRPRLIGAPKDVACSVHLNGSTYLAAALCSSISDTEGLRDKFASHAHHVDQVAADAQPTGSTAGPANEYTRMMQAHITLRALSDASSACCSDVCLFASVDSDQAADAVASSITVQPAAAIGDRVHGSIEALVLLTLSKRPFGPLVKLPAEVTHGIPGSCRQASSSAVLLQC